MTSEAGDWAEELAYQHLVQQGLRPVTRNYRCKRGEIDLIFLDGESHVFVEVRLRNHRGFGSGADSVGAGKRARIASTAAHYLQSLDLRNEPPCRFDVVSIAGQAAANEINWIRDAFQL